ncbi:hypothetical protein Tco_0669361 [Tanacetum coccineum]
MTNQKMRASPACKTYLAFATGATSPKKARKFKKHASPSRKRTLVTVEEEEPEPAKKVVPSKKSTSVQIRDTPIVYVSKKKALATTEISKGIDFLFEAALLEEDQVKEVLKRSRRETTSHQAGCSGDKKDVLESDDDLEQADDERTDFENQKTTEEDEEFDDAFVHTPEDYVPSGDETNDESNDVDKEEYERINEELYGDVNVRLTDAELADEEKSNKEMTNAETEIVTTALDAQKTEVPLQSSSISSDYASKFLNFDNIPSIKELKNVDHSSSLLATIRFEVPTVVKEYLGTNPDDALHKVLQRHTADVIKEQFVPVDVINVLKQQQKPQKTPFDSMHASKSFNKTPKNKSLYHALIESLIEDEMDQGVANLIKQKKRLYDDADKDKGPPTRSDQGLKRRKTSKYTKPSKKAKSTGTSKGTTKSKPKSNGK